MKYIVNGKSVTLEEFLNADVKDKIVFGRSCMERTCNKKGDVVSLELIPRDRWPSENFSDEEE